MAKTEEKPKRAMPKGGRKGGAVFPRVDLADAVGYAKKLVSKTHVEPQPIDVIYSGVVGAKSGTGNVRMSALKQYGLLAGSAKTGFSASDFAKKIIAAPQDEVHNFLRSAALRPTVFKAINAAFQGDAVSKSKIRQRAADLNVHPDETDTCTQIYVKSLVFAGLASVDGEQVTHEASSPSASQLTEEEGNEQLDPSKDTETNRAAEAMPQEEKKKAATAIHDSEGDPRPRAVFNVNVTLDSSLDIEKLARQLELLKKYGAI